MKKVLLFASIAIIFASCSFQPKFELKVNIHNNDSLLNKKFFISQKIDGTVIYSDSIKIKKNQFLVKIPYKGPALLNVSIPKSNVYDIMMAAEQGQILLSIDSVRPYFSGTPINDHLQVFLNGNDSVSKLFQQLQEEYESKRTANLLTPQIREAYQENRLQLINSNTDRTIAFIHENIDNPIGEYYFMIHYASFPTDRKLELNSFATDKLRKIVGIKKTVDN